MPACLSVKQVQAGVLKEHSMWHWLPRSWSYRELGAAQCWVLGTELKPLQEQQVLFMLRCGPTNVL